MGKFGITTTRRFAFARSALFASVLAASTVLAQTSTSWYRSDIGTPAATPTGSYVDTNGTISLTGGGVGVGGQDFNYPGTPDPYHPGSTDPRDPAYFEPGTGDGFCYYFRDASAGNDEIVARITSLSGPAPAQAGVMFRAKVTTSALNVALFAVNGSPVTTSTRIYEESPNHMNGTPGATYFWPASDNTLFPLWVKLVRASGGVMSFTSADGLTWTPQQWINLALGTSGYVGLVVSSHQDGTPATAIFDNVRIGTPTALIPAPAAPANLTASVYSSYVILSWHGDPSGYEHDEIERSVAGGPFVVISGVPDSDIVNGTTYTYRVRSVRGGSYSAYSNPVSATPGAAPTDPANLTVVSATDRQVDLQWTDTSSTESAFQLERWANSIYYYDDTVKVFTLPANTTTYSDTTVSPSTQYVYRISAVAGQVLSGPSNLIVATTAALSPTGRPVITAQPVAQAAPPGAPVTLSIATTASHPVYQWQLNGRSLTGANSSTLQISSLEPAQAGLYSAAITAADVPAPAYTTPVPISIAASAKLTGSGTEVGSDIRHPNGNIYDQILLQGSSVAVMADPGQVVRTSFIDLNDDIVQVEFSGAGTLTLTLDNATGPAPALRYNQPGVNYMKGHASIVITGANETSNVSVFSVGPANAVNASLFDGVAPTDGVADIAFIAISSTNGRFGGVFTGDTNYTATRGVTGIYAPAIAFDGPVYVADINAFDDATPVLMLGSVSDARVTGSTFLQPNARAIEVSGVAHLRFTAGSDSLGRVRSASSNLGRFEENGADVTSRIVTGASQ